MVSTSIMPPDRLLTGLLLGSSMWRFRTSTRTDRGLVNISLCSERSMTVLSLRDTGEQSLASSQSIFALLVSYHIPGYISWSLNCCDQLFVMKNFCLRDCHT
jgi:hypothetical protein